MSHQTLLDSLTTLLVLVVGLLLVLSIVLTWILPHVGSVLTTMRIQPPFSKIVDLNIIKPSKPKRVILTFNKSVGFYNGNILVKNGNIEIGRCELPVRSEYTNKCFKFYNEDISRQSNIIIISIQNYMRNHPLTLIINLNQNVHDQLLSNALKATEDEITVVVRGRKMA
jgi:hypothetical protein